MDKKNKKNNSESKKQIKVLRKAPISSSKPAMKTKTESSKIEKYKPPTPPLQEKEDTMISENEYESDFQDEDESDIRQTSQEIQIEEKYKIINYENKMQMKKYNDLKNIVKFEYSLPFEMINLPPIEDYDLFINRFANKNNIGIQSNEDMLDFEIQTQNVNMEDVWTQHPSIFLNSGDCCVTTNTKRHENEDKLRIFVEKAGKIFLAVLNEEKRHFIDSTQKFKYFDESYNVKIPRQLKNRTCSMVEFSNYDPNVLFTVHNPNYICIWNIKDPEIPQKILNCETDVVSLTSPLNTANEIYSGNIDGSILVWDLKLTAAHSVLQVHSIDVQNICPCYNTCYEINGHSSPVVDVRCVPISNELQFNYKLISIEKYYKLNIWSIYKSNDESTANFPGSKLKLFLTFTVSLDENIILFSLACHHEDNHYYLGTNIGPIRLQKQRKSGIHESYKNNHASNNILFMDFSTVIKNYFIAGTATSEILLYKINHKHPLSVFQCSQSQLILLKWIHSCPLMFFCVCQESEIYFFNLLESVTEPIFYEKVDKRIIVNASVNFYNEEISLNKFNLHLSVTFDDGKVKIFMFSQEIVKYAKTIQFDMQKLQENLFF